MASRLSRHGLVHRWSFWELALFGLSRQQSADRLMVRALGKQPGNDGTQREKPVPREALTVRRDRNGTNGANDLAGSQSPVRDLAGNKSSLRD